MKKSIRTKPKRGRPTSHAFASNRHQRPTGKLLFPDRTQVISDTSCRNCRAEMPPVPASSGNTTIDRAKLTITGYRCQYCGHWNDLKRRKKK